MATTGKMIGRYWDRAWQLVNGCTPCSPGCDHCWSMAMGKRFHKWPEQVTARFDRLDIPLRTRKPTVFCIWNDLFHEDVNEDFQTKAYAVMSYCKQHTFLILTKRPHVMVQRNIGKYFDNWPNSIWHGCTICNQAEADEKIPYLLKVPGKRWISIEPMLGEIDIRAYLYDTFWHMSNSVRPTGEPKEINAVIVGGETGPGARPVHPDWVRSVREQCSAAGVPFFFKQWGGWVERELPPVEKQHPNHKGLWLGRSGGYSRLFGYAPSDDAVWMEPIGSKRAGRLLDGREHNDLPWRI